MIHSSTSGRRIPIAVRTSAVVVTSLAMLAAGATLPAEAKDSASGSSTSGSSSITSTQGLSSLTNGKETSQVKKLLPEQDVLDHPQLSSAPPKTGQGNPGATMGQSSKSAADMAHLSEQSAKEAQKEVKQAEKGQTPQAVKDAQQYASTGGAATGVKTSDDDAVTGAAAATSSSSGIQGMDVSGWQPVVDWSAEYSAGARFTYIKASEGTSYTSSSFSSQYIGSTNAGMYRGAYHFALPGQSSGAAQAKYFVANGGGWSADGQTLPGLLDIEYNPYTSLGNTCYDLSSSQMVSWIKDFVNTYKSLTGRYPAIYTNNYWWRTCTGNSTQFTQMGLDVANYSSSAGTMPGGWSTYDIWQYSSSGPFTGDSNVFGGTAAKLKDFSVNASYTPIGGTASSNYYTASNGYKVKLTGAIGGLWNRNRSLYGQPIGKETSGLPDGGWYQKFSNGYTIYWTKATGAHAVKLTGGIGAKYASGKYEVGYGYPTSEESQVSTGVWEQSFRRPDGSLYVIVWSTKAGGYSVHTSGAIGGAWLRAGRSNGWGYPVTAETQSKGTWTQRFSKGVTASWTKSGGLKVTK